MSHDIDPTRPDPDALLADVTAQEQRRTRGRLKVFFGMSAGVGKTYAMLEEARKRAAEGVDVLVGYAEPHIRPDTEAILLALDILPYKPIEYRGATLKEFDLDAALARKPTICCVDELAHTNAPGMRHPKRWQDVSELLDAGIDVYTTLNVQHLESVNDLVERITGVRVRETLPDAVFDAADEVELVDIAPEELLERFREGRIYKPEQAERASRHFFTKGNLIALRELALRKTAERVDEQMQQHRREERVSKLIPSGERVLVCVGPSPLSARLVRSARRLAQGLRAPLIAAYVQRPGTSQRAAQAVEANLKLAEDLGATIERLIGDDVAAEVLATAVRHNVTKIVIGKPLRAKWKDVILGSVVDDLIRGSGEIDIYVIRGEAQRGEAQPSERDAVTSREPDWAGFMLAGAVVLLTTAIGWPLYHVLHVENENVLMLYLLGVLWIATHRSRGAAILASVFGVAAFDLMFVQPYYTFAVSDNQYVVTFLVMLLTAIVISTLTHRVRQQANAAVLRERRTSALLGLSRDLASAGTIDDIAAATVRHVGDVLDARAIVLLADSDRRLRPTPGAATLDEKELSVAQWAHDHERPAGHGTETLPAAAGTYVPLRGPRGRLGVIGVLPTVVDPSVRPRERRDLITAFAAQAAVAIERASLADEARQAWEMVESELLRNTLLSGVSHELRTPLAGITGAATALAERLLDEPVRRELLETLVAEADRMDRLITNLLDMTRMEAGGLALKREWVPINEVVGSSLRHLDRRLGRREITVHLPADLPLVRLDPAAIEQVIVNLLDNAVEYTPAESPIELSARREGDSVVIKVADNGPGLTAGSEKRVFDKFFRAAPAQGASHRGIGLGLAICRGIVESHSGTITASNRPAGGAVFTFTLPIGGTPPVVEYDGQDKT